MNFSLYDDLIDPIPSYLVVRRAVLGASWAAVTTDEGAGVAMRLDTVSRPSELPEDLSGLSLRTLASAAKSWNLADASLGVAAINAFYNSAGGVEKSFGPPPNPAMFSRDQADPFQRYRELARGRRVAAIGHFSALDTFIAPVCDLSIIEQHPRPGDYPDSASEYLLGEQEMVFITGCTLANKTLPRLLELSRGAFVVLVGPSTTMAPQLFEYGVLSLSGSMFPDPQVCLEVATGGNHGKMIKTGVKLSYQAPTADSWVGRFETAPAWTLGLTTRIS
jgi:hypothetical protein